MSRGSEYLYLAFLTEPREVSASTPHSPQHLTLVPPFQSALEPVLEAIREVKGTSFRQKFPVRVGEQLRLGPKQEIAAYSIQPPNIVAAFHGALVESLEKRGIDMSRVNHIRDDYLPHITIKPSHPALEPGQPLNINHIAVMEKTDKSRTMLAQEYLGQ